MLIYEYYINMTGTVEQSARGDKESFFMGSLKSKAYDIIKDNIIACRYTPGDFLNEAQLMGEVGVSRTPIREALNKLEQERLVRIVPKKGVMVSELTLREINEIYQVRLMLEPQVVRQWGNRIPVEELEHCRMRLMNYSPEMSMLERNDLDDSLHRLIIDYCPNSYIHNWSDHLYCQNQRVRIFTGQIGQRMELNNAGHLKILEKLLLCDYSGAAELMNEHLEEGKRNTFDMLLQMGL